MEERAGPEKPDSGEGHGSTQPRETKKRWWETQKPSGLQPGARRLLTPQHSEGARRGRKAGDADREGLLWGRTREHRAVGVTRVQ